MITPPASPDVEVVSTPHFTVRIEHNERGTFVRIAGALDAQGVPAFRRRLLALLSLPLEQITLDTTGAVFVCWSGIDVLDEVAAAARERRIDMLLIRSASGGALRNVQRGSARIGRADQVTRVMVGAGIPRPAPATRAM